MTSKRKRDDKAAVAESPTKKKAKTATTSPKKGKGEPKLKRVNTMTNTAQEGADYVARMEMLEEKRDRLESGVKDSSSEEEAVKKSPKKKKEPLTPKQVREEITRILGKGSPTVRLYWRTKADKYDAVTVTAGKDDDGKTKNKVEWKTASVKSFKKAKDKNPQDKDKSDAIHQFQVEVGHDRYEDRHAYHQWARARIWSKSQMKQYKGIRELMGCFPAAEWDVLYSCLKSSF
eukprot:TRINITY_DN2325_c0_g1_i2.p1 TRINITY_DN2325_c0_g1~~TRINITY_DN2325_c0_g1_i2.p1  ORF type:complete len:232 (-),score=67.06 TRINITY_DN2325_c0_g1_i2:241-936(-)